MKYAVDQEIFASFPGYRRGLVVVADAANGQPQPALEKMLRAEEARLRERMAGGSVLDQRVIASWREAFRKFGAKPSEHRSSIEAMTRRVVKPDRLPLINPLVDIGNLVSLRYVLPAGVHPLHGPDASFELRIATATDSFLPADGGAAETPPVGEVVFCSGNEVLTRRWTWRQAAGTQTMPGTRSALFNVDALAVTSDDELAGAMQDIEDMVCSFMRARVVFVGVLSHERQEVQIPFLD